MNKLKVLDLFAGIGGFSLGLDRTGGFETVAFCEIEPYPQKVLAKHWPGVPIYDDVRELTAERLATDGIRVDVITGGFPCQDISTAGKQASRQALKEIGLGCGQSAPVYLGTFDPDMPYLKTSQHCLVETMGDGLSRYSGTYPRSGMMRSGTVYQLPTLAPSTYGIERGLLPTLAARDYRSQHRPGSEAFKGRLKHSRGVNIVEHMQRLGRIGRLNPVWAERFMAYPARHTELKPSETP